MGSAGRLQDLIRRPSFAQDPTTDQTNKENMPGVGGYNTDLSSPVTTLPYAQSPPNMDGPVMFVVPELTDETLMSNEHRDTLGKLQFISTVICSLIELAQSRTSPLLESRNSNKLTGCVVFVSEKQRRIEQLVLYIRALHLLSSSLQLAKDEVAAGKLQPSSTVKASECSVLCMVFLGIFCYHIESYSWIKSVMGFPQKIVTLFINHACIFSKIKMIAKDSCHVIDCSCTKLSWSSLAENAFHTRMWFPKIFCHPKTNLQAFSSYLWQQKSYFQFRIYYRTHLWYAIP